MHTSAPSSTLALMERRSAGVRWVGEEARGEDCYEMDALREAAGRDHRVRNGCGRTTGWDGCGGYRAGPMRNRRSGGDTQGSLARAQAPPQLLRPRQTVTADVAADEFGKGSSSIGCNLTNRSSAILAGEWLQARNALSIEIFCRALPGGVHPVFCAWRLGQPRPQGESNTPLLPCVTPALADAGD